jgi:hypothetical protein
MHPAGVHGNQLGRIDHASATGVLQPSRRQDVYPTVTEHADGFENFEHFVPPTA